MARILIVEDDKYLNKLLTDRFILEGFKVDSTLDGESAWRLLESEQPTENSFDILLCDMLLPKMMGAELFAKIHESEIKRPKLIAISGIYKTPSEIEGLSQLYQLEGYWTKPFDIDALISFISGNANPEPTKFAQKGELIERPIEKLFFDAYNNGFTGKLHLKREGSERRVYFLNGFPVSADSSAVGESLGKSLQLAGLIDESVLAKASELMVSEKLQFGQTLIKMGALKKEQLFEGLRKHTYRLLLNTVAWKSGSFEFDSLKELPSHILALEFNWVLLILKAHRSIYPGEFLKSLFETKSDFYVQSSEKAVQILPLFNLDQDSILFFQSISGGKTVSQLIADIPVESHELVFRVLFLLENLGLIEFKSDSLNQDFTGVKHADFTKVFEVEKSLPLDEGKALQAEYMDMLNKDFFEIFEVTPDTPQADLDEAYRAVRFRLHPDRFGNEIGGQTKRILDDMLARIDKAYQTLQDPEQKTAYISASRRWKQDSIADSKKFLEAQDLFRQGLGKLDSHEYEYAMALFKKAHSFWDRGIEYRLYADFAEFKAYLHKQNNEGANAALQKLKLEAEQNALADTGFMLLGHAYSALSDVESAKEAYQQAIKNNDKNEEVANALAHLAGARIKKMKVSGAIQKSKRGAQKIIGFGIAIAIAVFAYTHQKKLLESDETVITIDISKVTDIIPATSIRQKSDIAKVLLKERWFTGIPDSLLKSKCAELMGRLKDHGILEAYLFDEKEGLRAVCRPDSVKRYVK